ncbi:preprotein translocase subunit YajC [Janibacter melonis]|uniref:preprotein translocase subunit YajC n=1 Tax=Janibacter melonis TaxID=262209 RepID=UPI001919BEAD|nr:preprotein translocase subunit YajC [Janibacter melonis]
MNDGSFASLLILLLPLLLIVFMVFSGRRRQRTMQDFQSSLAVGEKVVLTSGVYGTITGTDEGVLHLEIAPGTVIRVDRRAVGVREAEMSRDQVAGTAAARGEEPADDPVQDPVVTAEGAVDDEGQRGRP